MRDLDMWDEPIYSPIAKPRDERQLAREEFLRDSGYYEAIKEEMKLQDIEKAQMWQDAMSEVEVCDENE